MREQKNEKNKYLPSWQKECFSVFDNKSQKWPEKMFQLQNSSKQGQVGGGHSRWLRSPGRPCGWRLGCWAGSGGRWLLGKKLSPAGGLFTFIKRVRFEIHLLATVCNRYIRKSHWFRNRTSSSSSGMPVGSPYWAQELGKNLWKFPTKCLLFFIGPGRKQK